jgi:tetratricopeptide (TPR) repeat protein
MQGGSDEGNCSLAQAIQAINGGDYDGAVQTLDIAETRTRLSELTCRGPGTQLGERAQRGRITALRLNPHHFGAAAALGHALMEKGDLRGALRFYRKALRIHPRLEDLPDAVRELEFVLASQHGPGT